MSANYKTVNWNRNKIVYDLSLWFGILLYLSVFVLVTLQRYNGEEALSLIIVLMRALSTCAFLMLTLVLSIGPLARLNVRFLPLLYNRRHFGVSLFFIALLHAALAIFWYHAFGVGNPIDSVFSSGGRYDSVVNVPFQAYGALALLCLFLLAATSHDYWNANLGAPLWKAIHMFVYPAYALIVVHIVFGALQQDDTGLLPGVVISSVLLVGGLHILAAFKNASADVQAVGSDWVDVCKWQDIRNNRAITVDIDNNERIAVFRYDGNKLCAVANACQHQNGPLGEGCVVNGNIVCPWHGYEYRPEDGCSPPPFTEKIETYQLQLVGDRIQVDPTPLPAGSERPIVHIRDTVTDE
jgi:nitrite reductase/ring-hydroxylating ferredoxin subunit/DMSO/TMAO reductase YedYZ heme-binding membrane subunit